MFKSLILIFVLLASVFTTIFAGLHFFIEDDPAGFFVSFAVIWITAIFLSHNIVRS